MPADSEEGGKCAICGTDSLTRCGRCKSVFYCGPDHQRDSWPTHKADCKRLAAEKAAAASSTTSGSSNGAQDPLFVDFSWTAYEASSHRKPLGTHNRPPPQMSVHPMHAPGDTAAVLRMTTPWYPEEEFKNNRENAYEKLMNGFRLHCDDMQLWKDKPRGLYAKKDPYPEFEKFLRRAKPHLPLWWTPADTNACLARGRANKSPNIYDALEKDGFNSIYGSSVAAMGMRMWVDNFTDVPIGK